jgi:L-alanine-DL-glutamate epimerase-like enolase superfamily enzyme
MPKDTDVRISAVQLHLLPIATRLPLKFGSETLVSVTCARARVAVRSPSGRGAEGWGETPLSVEWAWPSARPHAERHAALLEFTRRLVEGWARLEAAGHALEIGHAFLSLVLPGMLRRFNEERAGAAPGAEPMPYLAALVCASAFDQALHDAYGVLHGRPVYETYDAAYLSSDLSRFLEPAAPGVSFRGRFPRDYLVLPRPRTLPAWHLVGGLDPLGPEDLDGGAPDDGHPVHLGDWIARDGLDSLKIKLRGNDAGWDHERIRGVWAVGAGQGVSALALDFNGTVRDPAYVNELLDRLQADEPRLFDAVLYVEQPFPHELEQHAIDVRSVAARKPLFLDESAHDWRQVRLGRSLGWTGVALKTCKTQTGALLALCWARAHGMSLMVQDLTNPMLALIPHALLAAHAGTLRGVETNQSQFYPEVSRPEAAVHPGLFRRRRGRIDLSTIAGGGFGYRLGEIERRLPEPVAEAEGTP